MHKLLLYFMEQINYFKELWLFSGIFRSVIQNLNLIYWKSKLNQIIERVLLRCLSFILFFLNVTQTFPELLRLSPEYLSYFPFVYVYFLPRASPDSPCSICFVAMNFVARCSREAEAEFLGLSVSVSLPSVGRELSNLFWLPTKPKWSLFRFWYMLHVACGISFHPQLHPIFAKTTFADLTDMKR